MNLLQAIAAHQRCLATAGEDQAIIGTKQEGNDNLAQSRIFETNESARKKFVEPF